MAKNVIEPTITVIIANGINGKLEGNLFKIGIVEIISEPFRLINSFCKFDKLRLVRDLLWLWKQHLK